MTSTDAYDADCSGFSSDSSNDFEYDVHEKFLHIVVRGQKRNECNPLLTSYCDNCKKDRTGLSWRKHNCTTCLCIQLTFHCYHCEFQTRKERHVIKHFQTQTCGRVRSSERHYRERKTLPLKTWIHEDSD